MIKLKTAIKLPVIILAIIIFTVGCAKSIITMFETAPPHVENEASTTGENQPEVSKGVHDNVFKEKVICIDAGHGNPNHPVRYEKIAPASEILKPATAYGTVGVSTKIPEYQLTMTVSAKIRDKLRLLGAEVIMTRESNETDLGNIERAETANKNSADISLRIHADGSEDSSVTGISVLYPGNKYITNEEMINKSKLAANFVLNGLVESTNGRSRGIVARNDLTGFNWSKVPAVLIEMGFLTNPAEDQALNTDDYQNKIVEGIIKGLNDYFNSI
ncbi:MAG TPA: N-acetylmuramoyl-L-alanine amidase [Desulfitobacteriaceae bacterium]|jgi:N-acetylmuramoyl-L-alanine amidase|nr:N-acetylmuramoyl-L-alanine amidase [Desulfitobacteriaceae bacterium]